MGNAIALLPRLANLQSFGPDILQVSTHTRARFSNSMEYLRWERLQHTWKAGSATKLVGGIDDVEVSGERRRKSLLDTANSRKSGDGIDDRCCCCIREAVVAADDSGVREGEQRGRAEAEQCALGTSHSIRAPQEAKNANRNASKCPSNVS